MPSILATLSVMVLLAASGSGCGSDSDSDRPDASSEISFQREGGIAGINQAITIRADGSGLFEKRYVEDAHGFQFQLDRDELLALNDLLRELDFDSVDAGKSPACADCFTYTVSYAGETITADDVTASPELHRVIAALDAAVPEP
jgi:hypothetical protein